MFEPKPSRNWDLEIFRPSAWRMAGAAGIAIGAAAAAAVVGGPATGATASLPLLGLTAIWLNRQTRPRSTARTIGELLEMLEARDRYTASHSSRVAVFADLIAEELGLLDPCRLRCLRIAALLHDIGKMDVRLEVLHKPGALDEQEWQEMRGHVGAGARRAVELTPPVCTIIEQHHERPDGTGYPNGLRGNEIALEALIVAVADAFDAMTSDRPYRLALDPSEAFAELRRCSEGDDGSRQFDPRVVAALGRRKQEAVRLCGGRGGWFRHAPPENDIR